MKIAFVYFPDFTLLDVVGVYDPLWRLRDLGIIPSLSIDSHAYHSSAVEDAHGFTPPSLLLCEPLNEYDLIFVPGGMGTRPLQYDSAFLSWLAQARDVPLIASVCTGSLLLGAAGLLEGHRATTHFNEYESLQEFIPEASVIRDRDLVDDGRIVTAGAVAASLTLGLHLCERLAGPAARESVRQRMNYR